MKIIKRDARCLASNDQIELLIEKLPSAKHILHRSRLHSKAKNNKNKMLNLIYNGCTNKEEAEKIIQQILKNKCF